MPAAHDLVIYIRGTKKSHKICQEHMHVKFQHKFFLKEEVIVLLHFLLNYVVLWQYFHDN